MSWLHLIKSFTQYLRLERSLSMHSIEAYQKDVMKLYQFVQMHYPDRGPQLLSYPDLQEFIAYLHDFSLSDRSQARIISGVKAFYKFLLIEGITDTNPADLLEGPKLSQKIPDFLSIEEIELILETIDMSTPHGQRNRAILETLYACGLRVSELINLRISQYFPDIGFVKVIGKNNKERIVPIGSEAIKQIGLYIEHIRVHLKIAVGHEDYIFLNRRGKKLSRIMIYNIIKALVTEAGIKKNVSPHTFRHSFATHLVEGGADLRAVQDMLGHESITTTEIYTHLDRNYLRETILMYHPASQN